jgi:hypothetical protein
MSLGHSSYEGSRYTDPGGNTSPSGLLARDSVAAGSGAILAIVGEPDSALWDPRTQFGMRSDFSNASAARPPRHSYCL